MTEEKEKPSKAIAEKLIIELAQQGVSAEKIGLELAKKGIHTKDLGIKVKEILEKHNLYKSPDIENLKKAIDKLKKHSEKNKVDKSFGRSLHEKLAKLIKLEKS